MDSHTLEGLTLRLEAAERGLRGARRAMWMGSILVVLAIGGGVWWFGIRAQVGTPPATIEAQHFVVRDAQGFARGVLESLPNGGTQLVIFRDPQPGDRWRELTGPGPFSFGVRTLSASSQLMLWNRDGANLQIMPGSVGMANRDMSRVVLESGPGDARLWLADSTGKMQVLNAALLADVAAKGSARPSAPAKHRRRH